MINEFNKQIVDTSIIESSCFFEYGNLAWGWTIRVSKNDTQADEHKFYIFVPGEIYWPK